MVIFFVCLLAMLSWRSQEMKENEKEKEEK